MKILLDTCWNYVSNSSCPVLDAFSTCYDATQPFEQLVNDLEVLLDHFFVQGFNFAKALAAFRTLNFLGDDKCLINVLFHFYINI